MAVMSVFAMMIVLTMMTPASSVAGDHDDHQELDLVTDSTSLLTGIVSLRNLSKLTEGAMARFNTWLGRTRLLRRLIHAGTYAPRQRVSVQGFGG